MKRIGRREVFILFYKEISFFMNKDREDWIYLSRKSAWGGWRSTFGQHEFSGWSVLRRTIPSLELLACVGWMDQMIERGVNSSLLLIWQIPLGGSEIAIEQTWKKIHPLTCLRTNSGFNTLPFFIPLNNIDYCILFKRNERLINGISKIIVLTMLIFSKK